MLLILTLSYAYYRRCRLPPARKLLIGFTIAIAALAALILLIGPVRVFYALHDYIFPDDNPWFFYYQDSLMTTLMKAPDLFGLIAVFLVALFAVLRSEEHTSELQSRGHLVCRLLLEKKKIYIVTLTAVIKDTEGTFR